MTIQIEPGQWLVTKGPAAVSGAQSKIALGPYSIHSGFRTPLTLLRGRDGTTIGCLLGEAVDLDRGILNGAQPMTLPIGAREATPPAIEAELYRLGGEWTAVIVCHDIRRIYQSINRALVYDVSEPRAAAGPASLMPRSEYFARFDKARFDARDILGMGWLPAGMTCHRAVERLLPNHALDLDRWQPFRHWSGPDIASSDPDRTVAGMAHTMTRTLSAIARTKSLNLAITAGHDSRAVLATLRPLLGKVPFSAFTIGRGDDSPDMEVPAEICAAVGVPHTLVAERRANAVEREAWLLRVGHCVGDANLAIHPTVWRFGERDAVITGSGGEIGRGRQWISSDTRATALTAHGIIARLEIAPMADMVERLDAWLAGLSGLDSLRILDLVHLEHRIGGWGAPQNLGNPLGPFHNGPLEHRDVVGGMLALPDDWRRKGHYVDALIAQGWPELARFPYNRFTGLKQLKYLAGRAFSLNRIQRKLRLHVVSRLAGAL